MRVLHVMPELTRAYGGPVEALIGFVAAAGGDAAEVTIAGPTPPPGELDWLRAQMPAARFATAPRFTIPAVVRRLAPAHDVVHVHGLLNPVSSGGASAALGRKRALIIGPFGTLSRYTFTHRRAVAKRLYFLAIDAPHLRRAAAVHFTTAAERDEAAWHGIDFSGRAHVVPPPWRSTSRGPSPTRTGETVLFLARLHPKKGLELLLEAWPAVRRARPAARLVIAGSGAPRYEAALRRAAEGVAGVEFTGFVSGDAKAARLAQADAFVLPSFNENFGIAVLEAVAAGLPAVVSSGVQLAPWVDARGVGRVAPRSADGLAQAIDGVLGDAGLRGRVARCGAEFVVDDFGPARVAPALLSMYAAAYTAAYNRT
jgi:glycosyltransferase involved in cell wall biosynthesis